MDLIEVHERHRDSQGILKAVRVFIGEHWTCLIYPESGFQIQVLNSFW